MAKIIDQSDPLEEQVRDFACQVIKGECKEPMQKAQAFLEKNEGKLPIKLAWLANHAIFKQNKDVLLLVKARDRILNRLLNFGLNLERDLPAFLRIAGGQGGERFREQTANVNKLCELAGDWIEKSCKGNAQIPATASKATTAYKDLMFSFCLAKLGEVENARKLQTKANKALDTKDSVHSVLGEGFNFRINAAIEGKSHSGQLSDSFNKQLAAMWTKTSPEEKIIPYKVVRIQEKSKILCPSDREDAYRSWRANTDDLAKELSALHSGEGPKVEKELKRLLKTNSTGKNWFRVMSAALDMANNLTEKFTAELITELCTLKNTYEVKESKKTHTVTASSYGEVKEKYGAKAEITWVGGLGKTADQHELEARAKLIERAMFLAAHYDFADKINPLVKAFMALFEGNKDNEHVGTLASQCLKGLRKMGLRKEIDRLLKQMSEVIGGKDKKSEPNQLRTLLPVAGGYFYFNKEAEAMPILESSRQALFKDANLQGVLKTKLVCRYAETLGCAPVELAMRSYEELFAKLGPINDCYTTNSHFSLSQLEVVEAVVMAIVSDAGVGQEVRRWLDEEEYLVRRRIHKDVADARKGAGV